jgi:hypothetical protein
MDVQEPLATAEQLLPGVAVPDGEVDLRWQAIIQVGNFVEREPESIWPFVLKWGANPDEDVRAAIATLLLEHLLEFHFDLLFPRIEATARSNEWFAKTTAQCWKLGQAKQPKNADKFDRLVSDLGAMPSNT